MDDNTLILLSLSAGPDSRAAIWESAKNDQWIFYTAKLDTGLVEVSTEEEIEQARSLCLSLPRMYGDFSSQLPLFATSLYVEAGEEIMYNTTSNIYNLNFTKIAKRQNYQRVENLENEDYDLKSSYDIVITDIPTGIETIIYSGFADNAMEAPLGLMLLGFTEDNQYIIYQNHSEIYVDAGQYGLIEISTGMLTPFSSGYREKVEAFLPRIQNTVWTTEASGPPGWYGKFDQNGTVNLMTEEYRSIHPISDYYEQTQTPATDIDQYSRFFRMARETPTLICYFEDENGAHVFLYDILSSNVTPFISGEKEVLTGKYGDSLSHTQQRLAFCVSLTSENEEEDTQRLLVYEQN